MRFRASSTWPVLPHHVFRPHQISHPAAAAAAFLRRPATFSRALHATPSSGNSGGGGGAQDNYLLVPGATMATILMLGILHARRLYDDKKSLQPRRRLRIVALGFILEDSTLASHLTLLGVPDNNGSPSHVTAFSLQSMGQGTSFRWRGSRWDPPSFSSFKRQFLNHWEMVSLQIFDSALKVVIKLWWERRSVDGVNRSSG